MIVSNATPLIAFARIQSLDLLRQVVGSIVIPAGVAEEIRSYRGGRYGIIRLSREPWIAVQSVQDFSRVQLLLPTLDQGEAEVIALALEQQARLLLIDELTGRKVAESLQLPVLGSVGILIRAKQLGLIRSVKPYIENMMQRGVRYSQRFIISVLHAIGE